jgi:hypothetical protein
MWSVVAVTFSLCDPNVRRVGRFKDARPLVRPIAAMVVVKVVVMVVVMVVAMVVDML